MGRGMTAARSTTRMRSSSARKPTQNSHHEFVPEIRHRATRQTMYHAMSETPSAMSCGTESSDSASSTLLNGARIT